MPNAEEIIDYQWNIMLERFNLNQIWRRNIWLYYDAIQTTSMYEVSPLVKWKPISPNDTEDVFILSTDVPEDWDNYLKVFSVKKNEIRATEIHRVKTDSRVNRLAFNPVSPDLLATQGQSGWVNLFWIKENVPQLIWNINSYSREGFGVWWNKHSSNLLLVSSGNNVDLIDVSNNL